MTDQRSPHPYGIAPTGFRLPEETHVGAVRLQVADLQRSIEYYRRVIGLRVLHVSTDAASLGVPGTGGVLIALHGRHGLRPVPARGTFGLYHFAIRLPDRASLGRFARHLSSLGMSAGMSDHRVSEALYLTDPDGLGIEVYADRPRSQWRQIDRQLVVTTDPLDARDLVAAGAGIPWDEAPQGTKMGHVHLHVGNLEEAAAFYHQALGFDIVAWSYPGALFFSAGGYHHHLGTNTWSPGPSPADDQARLLDWELILPTATDAEAAGRSVGAAGHSVVAEGHAWMTTDPWGTRVRIAPAG